MHDPEISLPTRLLQLIPAIEEYRQSRQAKPLIEKITQMLPAVVGVERCSVFLLDPINRRVLLQYGTGMLERELNLPLAGTLAGEVIQSGIPRIVEDLSPYQTIQNEVKEMTGFQAINILCVPIHYPKGDSCAGAIQLINGESSPPFNNSDITELTALSQYIREPLEALILQHVKFLQEVERKKKRGNAGIVASFLSKWSPIQLGGK